MKGPTTADLLMIGLLWTTLPDDATGIPKKESPGGLKRGTLCNRLAGRLLTTSPRHESDWPQANVRTANKPLRCRIDANKRGIPDQ
jgi:hypothetical protein